MAVRKQDYEDEEGNIDWVAYEDAKDMYGDMKYQERKDESLEREDQDDGKD